MTPAVVRYWHTVRHLRASQIVARIDLRSRAAGRRLSPAIAARLYARRAARADLRPQPDPWRLRAALPAVRRWMSPGAFESSAAWSVAAAGGTFEFLNSRRDLGLPIDWSAGEASQLWRYHLHYFDYLPDLIVSDSAALARQLMSDWVARVPMAHASTRDAWHPYVVSLRLVNWMLALAAAPDTLHPDASLIDSLRQQTIYVRRNLETDVGGNHLLKNLKALAIAGCFWSGPAAAALRERFAVAFTRELAAQLRSDGGHYEQSPMYHAQVFGDAIELALILRRSGWPDPSLERLIGAMREFLARVTHPDGQLVQFGDTAMGMTPEPDALLGAADLLNGRDAAGRLESRHALLAAGLPPGDRPSEARLPAAPSPSIWDPQSSGFIALPTDDGRGFLIADAGPVCPDDLPAHAHSDLFGFEVSLGRTRLVVDSGVSEYAPGPWRDYYRSTRAHSTVMVDGTEQTECWGSFRAARRARIVSGAFESDRHIRGFVAAHDGFTHLRSPVVHRRRFLLVAGRLWLIVDELLGTGVHRWTTFLHLHPEVVLHAGDGAGCHAARAEALLHIAWFGMDAPRAVTGQRGPLQGWYAPAFGRVQAAPTLVSHGSGPLPVRFGWMLAPVGPDAAPVRVETLPPDRLRVHIGGDTIDAVVPPLLPGETGTQPAARSAAES